MPNSHKFIYAFYVIIWIFLAIDPKYPEDWLLENVLVFILFPTILWLDKKYHFSLSSVMLLLVFTFAMVTTIATLYEILEWFAVITFHADLGVAFLGTQGDVWDAQQDILLAIIGALINVALFYPSYANKR